MRQSRSSFKIFMLLPAFLLCCGSIHAQTNSGKLVFSDEFGRLLLINADGSGQTVLTAGGNNRDANPAYSPDGSKIAFDRYIVGTGRTNIFLMNADGTNPVAVTLPGPLPNTNLDSDPTWSPDGKKLAFVSDRGGQRKKEIWVINVDGTGLVQLTTNVAIGSDSQGPFYAWDVVPSWSPDGSRIVFASARDAISSDEIYLMNPDGSNQARLTNNTLDDFNPTWSADSQKIAFFRNGSGINIMNRDGTHVVNVTNDGFAEDWSPDGTRLAFQRFDPSNNSKLTLFIINVDGTNLVKITNNAFNCMTPAWAPMSSPPIPTSTISGLVLDGNGTPVSGASLNLTGNLSRSTQTDATGTYAFAGLPVGNYKIVIAKSGFGFIPPSVDINNLTTDQTVNFTAFTSFSISGRITGLGGNIIVVNLSGLQNRSVQTDPSGNYSFDLLPAGGNYTVSFNTQIWNISPNSATVNNLSSNQTANFNAVRFTYTISGTITRLGNPLPGVTVAIDNGSGFTPPTTTTDQSGHYLFTGVTAGINYGIRPTAANYLFDPQTAGFSQLDGNKIADFIALSANHLVFNTRYVFGGATNNCNVVLTVFRGGNAQGVGPITVPYATSDGSATAGSDYTAVAGTLNFPEGTYSQTVTIPLLAGPNTGLPRTFMVTLSNPTGQVDLGDPSRVTVVLTDPAPPSSLVLATQPNTNRAVALNASNLLAEPFNPSTPINFAQDTKTRVSFFVSGVQFNACQGTNALFFSGTDSQQHSFFGTVDEVVKLPGNNPYLQLTITLPQGLITGDWTINFTLGNLTSNTAHISTRP